MLLPITTKHRYTIPDWLAKVPATIFPDGPKSLYTYLLVFGASGCWQYNCRLAERFQKEERTIRRWLNWLKSHRLIYIHQPYNRRRRIIAYNYNEQLEWFTNYILKPKSAINRADKLSSSEFQKRKCEQVKELLGDTPLFRQVISDPYPIKDSLPNLTQVTQDTPVS